MQVILGEEKRNVLEWKIIGEMQLPPLVKLRDGNYTVSQYYAKRDGPTIVFKGEPVDKSIIENGGIVTGTIVVKEDSRRFLSVKESGISGSRCLDENLGNKTNYSMNGPVKAGPSKKRMMIRIYHYSLEEIKKRVALYSFATRSTGMGGLDSYSVLSAKTGIFVGRNRSPSENHGCDFWILEGPGIIKTDSRGNGKNSAIYSQEISIENLVPLKVNPEIGVVAASEENGEDSCSEILHLEGSGEIRCQVNGIWQHKHEGYDYWHSMARAHKEK